MCVQYEPGAQERLEPHFDQCLLSFVIQISDLADFEGGGTRFLEANQGGSSPVSAPQGGALLFCGHQYHEGVTVSNGVRLIIAGFVDYHPDRAGGGVVWSHARASGVKLPQLRNRLLRPHLLVNLRLMCEDCAIDWNASNAGGQLVLAAQSGYRPANTSQGEMAELLTLADGYVGTLRDLSRLLATKGGDVR